ncbi:MAG: helix-turn-helix transcriptional regulator [Candidatus Pacebacteria bacterium]|nr:helix-turn-helix transcriptional regulator [Candidatus Paceibacterota bacterium]
MPKTIKNSVKQHRSKLRLTQEELSDSIGVTRQTIIALEKGNYIPSLLLAFKIAHFFKEPVEVIFKVDSK